MLLARAEARRSESETARTQETACQRDLACKALSIAVNLCDDLADRRDVQGGLSEQHRLARDTGAIDLDELAERADALEAIDARLSEEEARYRAVAGRPFNRRSCRADLTTRGN